MVAGNFVLCNYQDGSRLISFVYENMDDGHRISWPDLTGREQGEWIARWEDCGRDFRRHEDMTRGLRGTNINTLQDRASVQAAMRMSPSLSRRRPANHVVAEDDWTTAANKAGVPRRLFF